VSVSALSRNLRVWLVLAVSLSCVLTWVVCSRAWGSVSLSYQLVGSIHAGLVDPTDLTVDQSTGDVYVIDLGTNTVHRFYASGKPAPFSASASYIENNQLLGTSTGGFSFGYPTNGIVVDGSNGPAKGDLYITDSGNGHVAVFGSDGSFLGDLDTALATPMSGGEPCGLAVDGSGNVFVGWSTEIGHGGGHVDEFKPTDSDPADDVFVGQLENLGNICSVAAGTKGETFVNTFPSGSGPLLSYEASQFGLPAPVSTEVASSGSGFAVDPDGGHLFTVSGSDVVERDSTGAPIGEPFGSIETQPLGGLAVNGALEKVYVSSEEISTGAKRIDIFEVPKPDAPSVDSESVASVTSSSAQFNGEINPHVLSSIYYLEYGITTDYGQREPVSGHESVLKEGLFSDQPVATVYVQGLLPETTYHYRFVAHNAFGGPGGTTTDGLDHTFTTQGTGSLFMLPDDRGWEMVSPVEKNGVDLGDALGGSDVMQAALDGNSITFVADGAFASSQGSPTGAQYFSVHDGPGDWSTQGIATPMNSFSYATVGGGGPYKAFSANLQSALELSFNSGAEVTNPPLTPGAPAGYQN
jgi:hypothetical protein